MNRLFDRAAVKAVLAILCILCLTAAGAGAAGTGALLYYGVYDGSGDLFRSIASQAMQRDMEDVMYDYFDPQDPAHPWQSRYSDSVYTGERSNFIYRIVDDGTGRVVLASYTGTPGVALSLRDTFSYSVDVEVPASETPPAGTEDFVLERPIFLCNGTVYAYNRDSGAFFPVYDESADAFTNLRELPLDVKYVGFTYDGCHYDFDGFETFTQGYWLEESRSYTTETRTYTMDAYLLGGLPYQDEYRNLWALSELLMSLGGGLPLLFAAGGLLGLGLLILLCWRVDHVYGKNELALNPIYRIPTDAALAGVLLLLLLTQIPLKMARPLIGSYLPAFFAVYALTALWAAALCIYALVMLFARGKMGILFTGTLVYWLWKNLARLLQAAGRGAGKLLRLLPGIWKALVLYGALCLGELFLMFLWGAEIENVFLWFLEHLVGAGVIVYVSLAFQRLKKGAEAIAAGDYSTQVSERNLLLDFKDTARTLNHIRDGMNAAVDSRTRSERMKTELITNVSHDLKTPLTSIVSYVDLLKQELGRTEAVSQQAEEYLSVLERQSARLKKLIEDLVEASKASTGNLNLQLETLDLNLLLGQALGEYSQRLLDAKLTLMTRLTEEPVHVRADGRRLWRVFDNLLGNAVKYAMPGTRLYLTVEVLSGEVQCTFRNISREPLEVSAEELMERFVRGDESRHTEGSGLGLSIARSLTESMGGRFQVELDGDLFKALVILPVLSELPPAAAGSEE